MNTLKSAKLSWVVLGFVTFGILIATGTFRWNILLRAQGIHLTARRTTGLFLIGYFFNHFIPGSTGGARDGWDVVAPIAAHAASQLRGGDHPE